MECNRQAWDSAASLRPWLVLTMYVVFETRGQAVEITMLTHPQTVITDYPSPVVLENIRTNASTNIPERLSSQYSVEGQGWGVLETKFAIANKHHFNRVLAADCFWMPSQHANLVATMLHFLAPGPSSRVLTVAGFHTGRTKLAGFYDEAVSNGLEIEEIYEEDAEGHRREWTGGCEDGVEDHTERKKWLVICTLRRCAT